MVSIVASAKTRNIGKIFLSDVSTASAHLPSYFSAELSAIVSQRDGGSTTPPPAPQLTISSVTASPDRTSAAVSWQANLASTGTVVFGLTPSSLIFAVPDATSSTSHRVVLNGLSRKTTYYYQVLAQTPDGSLKAASAVGSFRTRP
jgi:hypothetical protein